MTDPTQHPRDENERRDMAEPRDVNQPPTPAHPPDVPKPHHGTPPGPNPQLGAAR